MKIKNIIRKIKYAEERVYIFCELKKKDKAQKAMRFYEMVIAGQVALFILLSQLSILGLILLLR